MALQDLIPRTQTGVQVPWLDDMSAPGDLPTLPVGHPMTPMQPPSLLDMSAPASPSVVPQTDMAKMDPSTATDMRIAQAKGRLNDLQAAPTPATGFWGKVGHVLGRVGDVAETIISPETAALTPGTSLNKMWHIKQAQDELQQAQGQKTQEDQQAQSEAQESLTEQQPGILQAKLQQKTDIANNKNAATLAQHGFNYDVDENGVPNITEDPNSQAYKDRVSLSEMHDATAQKDQIQAEIAQNHYVPGTPEYVEAQRKLSQVDQRLHVAMAGLGLRAQGLELRKENQAAQNTGIDPKTGKPFAGAQQISDANGNMTTVGSRFASGAVNAQGSASQYNDVHGALNNVESAGAALAAKNGGKLNTPGVIAALTAAHNSNGGWITGGISNFLKSENASSLTPEERNYVTSVQAFHENIQPLRKSTGGGVTDSQVDRLEDMAPGPTTPDLDYLKNQTGQIRATADRLAPGVSTVSGGLAVRGKGSAPSSPSAPKQFQSTATGPGGHKIGFDGTKWVDVQTGKEVK